MKKILLILLLMAGIASAAARSASGQTSNPPSAARGGGDAYSLAAYGNDLARAISAIGAAAVTLPITRDVTCSGSLTVPPGIVLLFSNQAKIIESGSCTINFKGIGIADPESQNVYFSGFEPGDITFTGAVFPPRMSSTLWADASLSSKLSNAIAALPSKQATVIAYPGQLTAQVTVTAGKSVYFTRGTYTNTNAETAFILHDNTRFYGDGMGQTFLEESGRSLQFIRSSGVQSYPFDGYNENIEVSDITFKGNPSTAVDSAASAVFLGNVTNGHIRRNEFLNTHGFAAYVGGFGTSGHQANGVYLTDNICKGLQTQNMGTVGGQNVHISRNTFILTTPPGAPSLAVIDIEPNTSSFGSDNIQITNNIIDGRLAQVSFNGITVQKAYGANLRNVRVSGNQIIGFNNTRVVVRDSEINLGTETFTAYSHGFQTGQSVQVTANDGRGSGTLPAGLSGTTYTGYIIVTAIDSFQIASSFLKALAGTALDITGKGYGEYLFVPNRRLANGLQISDVDSVVLADNEIIGASQNCIYLAASYNAVIRNNTCVGSGGGGIEAMAIYGSVNSDVSNNILLASPHPISQSTEIIENESVSSLTVSTTAGSPLVTVATDRTVPWWYKGMTITINGVDYLIRERLGRSTLALTTNALSSLSGVAGTLKASSNSYRGNRAGSITLSPTGSSVIYTAAGDLLEKGTVTVDPASIAADTVSTQTFKLNGAAIGDSIVLNPPAAGLTAGLLVLQVRVSAANQISVTFQNTTASPIDQRPESWTYLLSR